jgi:cyanate lyase
MKRMDVVGLILEARKAKGLQRTDLAAKLGKSKEWVNAGCLGHSSLSSVQMELGTKLGCERAFRSP